MTTQPTPGAMRAAVAITEIIDEVMTLAGIPERGPESLAEKKKETALALAARIDRETGADLSRAEAEIVELGKDKETLACALEYAKRDAAELLAALKDIVHYYAPDDPCSGAWGCARAAIAKAEGRA